MSKRTVTVIRYNRYGKELQKAEMINAEYAYAMCDTHMQRHPANVVKVEGRLCYTQHQVETQLRNYFNSIQA